MGQLVVCPVGLSIFQGRHGLRQHNVNLKPGHEAQTLGPLLESLGADADLLSAELATIKALKPAAGDRVVFLATDTDEGDQAARANAAIAAHRFDVSSESERVGGLVLDSATIFRRRGIPSLIQVMDRHIDRALRDGLRTVLGVSGGIKPVVPYVALYGMLRGVPVAYLFEREVELITLPPLPIEFDWAALATAERAFREVQDETAISRARLEGLLGDQLTRMEGLFEDAEDGLVTLSGFGLMLVASLGQAAERPVMLSPSARRRLDGFNVSERKVAESMLDRVRNPVVRASKRHEFRGTDLDVYKPGNTAPRLAYWVGNEGVYIAEIYLDHDTYEKELLGRLRQDYPTKEFTPHWPAGVLTSREVLDDETVAVALDEKARAEQERDRVLEAAARVAADRDAALALAGTAEAEAAAAKAARDVEMRSARELEERALAAEARQARMASWGVWRRLQWVLGKD